MKIRGVEVLRADAGFCNAWFRKVTTNEGLTGWAFGEHTGTAGLSRVVTELGALAAARDFRLAMERAGVAQAAQG